VPLDRDPFDKKLGGTAKKQSLRIARIATAAKIVDGCQMMIAATSDHAMSCCACPLLLVFPNHVCLYLLVCACSYTISSASTYSSQTNSDSGGGGGPPISVPGKLGYMLSYSSLRRSSGAAVLVASEQ